MMCSALSIQRHLAPTLSVHPCSPLLFHIDSCQIKSSATLHCFLGEHCPLSPESPAQRVQNTPFVEQLHVRLNLYRPSVSVLHSLIYQRLPALSCLIFIPPVRLDSVCLTWLTKQTTVCYCVVCVCFCAFIWRICSSYKPSSRNKNTIREVASNMMWKKLSDKLR